MILVVNRNVASFKNVHLSNKIISNTSYISTIYLIIILLLTICQSSDGYYYNDILPNYPVNPASFVYPSIGHFGPAANPYAATYSISNPQLSLNSYPLPMVQQSLLQQTNLPANFWNLHQSNTLTSSDSHETKTNLPSDSNGNVGDNDTDNNNNNGNNGEADNNNINGEQVPPLTLQAHENHEKQAEKNTEKMWPEGASTTSNRRFGLLTKLWRKKKAKKQSTKHKHDHFHHQNVHHHHHHHHYHHHIHHYPGKKPKPLESALKKFKYKWKFKSKIKEIGEAPPTQSIYDQPPPAVYPPPPPPPPYTVHHHHPGHAATGYW